MVQDDGTKPVSLNVYSVIAVAKSRGHFCSGFGRTSHRHRRRTILTKLWKRQLNIVSYAFLTSCLPLTLIYVLIVEEVTEKIEAIKVCDFVSLTISRPLS